MLSKEFILLKADKFKEDMLGNTLFALRRGSSRLNLVRKAGLNSLF